jgi:hypothetical protein
MILRRTHEMVSGDLSAALARQVSSENTVLSLQTQVADYTLDGERFALLSAWGGRQEITLDSGAFPSTTTRGCRFHRALRPCAFAAPSR